MAKVFVSREVEEFFENDANILSLGHDIIDKLGNENSETIILVSIYLLIEMMIIPI